MNYVISDHWEEAYISEDAEAFEEWWSTQWEEIIEEVCREK